eukprot:jgi/Tetstr1/455860/TSEL_042649.t1
MQRTAQKEDMATTELAPNLLKGKYVGGVVTCKDCMRPRCMYSLTHPRNMEPASTVVDGKKVQPSVTEKAECKQYALQNFHAAAEHNSFFATTRSKLSSRRRRQPSLSNSQGSLAMPGLAEAGSHGLPTSQ